MGPAPISHSPGAMSKSKQTVELEGLTGSSFLQEAKLTIITNDMNPEYFML